MRVLAVLSILAMAALLDPTVEPATLAAACSPQAGKCADCHREIAGEWRESAHARAFVDEHWRAELARTKSPERCMGCHAPASVHERLGRPPRVRETDLEHGVDCAACHVHRSQVLGPFGSDADGHSRDGDPLFREASSSRLCAGCHDLRIGPVLPLARDHAKSAAARAGKGCVRCHMPHVERAIANDPRTGQPTPTIREGRRHELLGPSDADFAASAFDVAVTATATELRLTIGNLAGHRVPGLVGRAFEFTVESLDGQRVLDRQRVVIDADNLLYVDETRRFAWPRAAGAIAAKVRIVHRFLDSESLLDELNFSW